MHIAEKQKGRSTALLCLAVLSLVVPGCGPSRGDLKGVVTYRGKTLRTGSVLVSTREGPKASKIEPDGTYEIKRIPVGELSAIVTSPDPAAQKILSRTSEADPARKDNSQWFPIPANYGEFKDSGLTYPLKAGQNTWDIELN